jgi:hypothetical protein
MIIVLAGRYDAPARRLKDRWAGADAHLFTCDDLSVSGWRYRLNDPLNSTAIINGRGIKQSKIAGVVTRLSWIWEGELVHIVAHDRGYVAAEMSAFLVFWLSGLTCPVLNRPTANSFNGPGWGRERWNFAASEAGMRVDSICRRASLAVLPADDAAVQERHDQVSVTVIGEQCLGNADKTLKGQARRLATIAGVDFLEVQFGSADADAAFVGINTFPDIDNAAIADAALSYLRRS